MIIFGMFGILLIIAFSGLLYCICGFGEKKRKEALRNLVGGDAASWIESMRAEDQKSTTLLIIPFIVMLIGAGVFSCYLWYKVLFCL